LIGFLYSFRAQTGYVAYRSYVTFVLHLGEALAPGEGSTGRTPTLIGKHVISITTEENHEKPQSG
jgi:hypothetical protein